MYVLDLSLFWLLHKSSRLGLPLTNCSFHVPARILSGNIDCRVLKPEADGSCKEKQDWVPFGQAKMIMFLFLFQVAWVFLR